MDTLSPPSGAVSPVVVQDFFARAGDMRAEFEARVGPNRTALLQRFVWDYWHVPDQYSYIRTFARQFFSPALYRDFAAAMSKWGDLHLGCSSLTEPWLSYYIDGCGQNLHSDVVQGAWAFVFSLTHWDERRFTGGETVLLDAKTLDYWRHFDPERPLEHDRLFEQLPLRFNQLTVFDGRIPHGVAHVAGSRDPLNSRVAIHGWFREPVLRAEGGLSSRQVEQPASELIQSWQRDRPRWGKLNGSVTLRLRVGASGAVTEGHILCTNLVSLDGRLDSAAAAAELALNAAQRGRFPETNAGEDATVTLPFIARDR